MEELELIPMSNECDLEADVTVGFEFGPKVEAGYVASMKMNGGLRLTVFFTKARELKSKEGFLIMANAMLSGGHVEEHVHHSYVFPWNKGKKWAGQMADGKWVINHKEVIRTTGFGLKNSMALDGFKILSYKNGTITTYAPELSRGVPRYDEFEGEMADRITAFIQYMYMVSSGVHVPERAVGGSCLTCEHLVRKIRAYVYDEEHSFVSCARHQFPDTEIAYDDEIRHRMGLDHKGSTYYVLNLEEESTAYSADAPWMTSQKSMAEMLEILLAEYIIVETKGSANRKEAARKILHDYPCLSLVENLDIRNTVSEEYERLVPAHVEGTYSTEDRACRLDHFESIVTDRAFETDEMDPESADRIMSRTPDIIYNLMKGVAITTEEYERYHTLVNAFERMVPEEKALRKVRAKEHEIMPHLADRFCLSGISSFRTNKNGDAMPFYGARNEMALMAKRMIEEGMDVTTACEKASRLEVR